MAIVKGSASLSVNPNDIHAKKRSFIQNLADKFTAQMNYFHSLGFDEPEEMMIYWHESFSEQMKSGTHHDQFEQYLRPSSIGGSETAHWYNLHGYKSDEEIFFGKPRVRPFRHRWQNIGTVIGDAWQRMVLSAEYHKKANTAPFDLDFKFERNEKGYPMFEEFARKSTHIGGVPLAGTCDGILRHIDRDLVEGTGLTRIGFEVKSKQTTYATTGDYSMRHADPKHVMQAKTYAMMFGLDYYFIIYQNCSKKSWNMSKEDELKYPDFKVFGAYFSPEEKQAHEEYIKSIWALKDTDEKPKVDLLKWTFNSHKVAILENFDLEDHKYLTAQVLQIESGRYSAFEKKQAREAYDEIEGYLIENKGLYANLGGNDREKV